MTTTTTRRIELGLPLFPDLGYNVLVNAGLMVMKGASPDIPIFLGALATAGRLTVIRKLSAIWRATDLELKMAEGQPAVMADLEAQAAERPFSECFRDAMAFHDALWTSFVPTPESSQADAAAHADQAQSGTQDASLSGS